jgi:exosome complex RNA-binding protein Rrp42 (RNase PH superfamily)
MSVRLHSIYGVGSINIAFSGSISTADGSALVRLGDTTIVCGVKAEIAEPDLDRPDEGFLGKHLCVFLALVFDFPPCV